MKRMLEIAILLILVSITLTSLCWGPPLPPSSPPSVPVTNPVMSAIAIGVIAGWGWLKSKK